MSSILDFITSIPIKLGLALVASGIIFLLYYSIDIYLFITKRHFGRVNVELVYFTKNDNPKRADAIHFRTIAGPIFLKKAYDNRFLFWRVIFRSLKAKKDCPVVDFGRFTYMALVPFRDRVAAKCALGELKRALGLPFRQKKCQLVMVYEQENKRRFILKILVIQEDDLRNIESHLKNLPRTKGNFELFRKVARTFQVNPKAFLPVQIVVA